MGEVFKLNHCYNVDCVPAMELFPDNYFDLAVVDPPYFSGPERRGFYGSKVSKIGVHRDYPISPAWIRPGPEYFRELLRVSRHYIVWGCNYFDYKFATGRIVWDKCNGSSSFSDCEIAATDLFTSVRLFRYMWSGMMQGKSIAEGSTMQGNKSMNEKRIHPTQKPVVLYDWIFKNYAETGQKVLDTHLGSGSSRIAAYEAGLDFIGFEKVILEKLHRRINEFHKAFNWRRFRRDALHLGESLLVFGVLYGIFSTLIWGVCWIFKINYDPDLVAVAWAVPVLLDTLVNKAYDWNNEVRDWD